MRTRLSTRTRIPSGMGGLKLAFDAQTGSFSVGNTITGGTSVATATIVGVADAGTTGVLTLDGITGTFQDDEIIYESALGSELLSNTGFETAGGGDPDFFANWTESAGDGAIADETVLVNSGSHAAKLSSVTGAAYMQQSIVTVAEVFYKITHYTRGDGSYAGRYSVWDSSNSDYIVTITSTGVPGTTYTQNIIYFRTPTGCISIGIYCFSPTTLLSDAYFDDFSLKQATNAALANGVVY